jgi:hypothetical protein
MPVPQGFPPDLGFEVLLVTPLCLLSLDGRFSHQTPDQKEGGDKTQLSASEVSVSWQRMQQDFCGLFVCGLFPESPSHVLTLDVL